MITNLVREKLLAGDMALGCFANIVSPTVVELLGYAGFDFVVVDAEHTTTGPESAESLYRAAEARGIVALTRISESTPQFILKYMDAGSLGVQIPMVSNAADAQRVVDSVKYPPLGKRGLAFPRAAGYGLAGSLADYIAAANEATLVVVQVETEEGMTNTEAIAAVEGVDVVFLGPTDLSVVLGFPGQSNHPKVREVIESLAKRIVAAGKIPGTIARNVDDFDHWRPRGIQYFLASATTFLGQVAASYIKSIREREQPGSP
jgi:2-keto-3-deoxy-L-rhamnonate aldolase RhmA